MGTVAATRKGTRATVGQLAVGDYVGHHAAEAAQAVRRAGLRPALERCLDVTDERTGTVVDQYPAAGSLLARNTMVTLHVAAPAPGPREAAPDGDVLAGQLTLDGADAVPPGQSSAEAEAETRLVASAGPAAPPVEPPVQPELPWPEPPEPADPETGEPSVEELTARLGDVLAGHAGISPRRRRVYPRRPSGPRLSAPRAWVASHPAVTTIAFAAALIWVAVALTGSPGATPHRQTAAAPGGRAISTASEQRPPSEPPSRTRVLAEHSSRRGETAPPRPQARRAPSASRPHAPRARSVSPSVQVTLARSAGPPERVQGTAPRTPSTPAQTPGGPFSP